MGEDEGQFSTLGNLLSPGIEEKWSGIAIFEYSWFDYAIQPVSKDVACGTLCKAG